VSLTLTGKLADGKALDRRRDRWRRRAIIARLGDGMAARRGSWDSVPFARTAACGRAAVGDSIEIRAKDGSAYPVGLSTCSSVWACPCCSPKIRTRRGVELSELASAHAAAGGSLSMMTLTLRHGPDHGLKQLLDGLTGAYRELQQGPLWRALKCRGLIGQVRSLEITHGFVASGPFAGSWHPHLHVLLLWEGEVGDVAWIEREWADLVDKRLGVRPGAAGFDHREIAADAAAYISKISAEVTRADLKGSTRSLWSIVDAVADGETWAIKRWSEYVSATKGLRAIQYSRGLRGRYGLGTEATDEALAAADVDGELLAVVEPRKWRRLMRAERGCVPPAVRFLEELERRAGLAATG